MVVSQFTWFLTVVILASILVLVPLLYIMFRYLWGKKYRHTLVIIDVLAGAQRVLVKRCCDYNDKQTKVRQWKVWWEGDKLKKFAPLPPNDMIMLTPQGRNLAVAVRVETGEMTYINPRLNIKAVPLTLYDDMPNNLIQEQDEDKRLRGIEEWKKDRKEAWMLKEGVGLEIQPFTPNQRLIQMYNNEKADSRRNKGLMEQLPLIVGGFIIIAAIILIIVLVVQWGEITKPGLDLQKERTLQLQLYERTAKALEGVQAQIDQKVDKGTAPG